MSTLHVLRDLSSSDTNVIVAILSAVVFILFLWIVLCFTWRTTRPQTPSIDGRDSAVDEEEAERFYAFRIVQPSSINALGQRMYPMAAVPASGPDPGPGRERGGGATAK
ncbi:uncharacterized protein FTOL_09943 [Fusarium torulosum]|uniref:Uncharacterized protein n=1 Tax=Fusarium torulosum TaxID=33205 RepID=A0AAE8MFI2_9HYPO|nr:uncharacterized protein FTOL_09943 [Fusarium torulosum]